MTVHLVTLRQPPGGGAPIALPAPPWATDPTALRPGDRHRAEAAAAAQIAKRRSAEDTRAAILRHLSQTPATARDIGHAAGVHHQTAQNFLRDMLLAGTVQVFVRPGRAAIWSLPKPDRTGGRG
jgi:hypothetical protein